MKPFHLNKISTLPIRLGQSIEYACYGYLVFSASASLLDQQPLKLTLLIIACFSLISIFSMDAGEYISNITNKTGKKSQKYFLLSLLILLSSTIILIIDFNQIILVALVFFISKFYQGMMHANRKNQSKISSNQKIILFSFSCLLGLISCLSFNEIKNTQPTISCLWASIAILFILLSTLSIKRTHHCEKKFLRIFNKIKRLLTHHKKETIYLFTACAFTIIQITTCTIYSHFFMLRYTEINYHNAFTTTIFGLFCLITILPFTCLLTDKLEKSNLIIIGLIGTIITPPLLFMLDSMDLSLLRFAGHLIYALFICSACAPLFKIIGQLIPLALRHIALSLSFGFSIPVFGTTTSHIADKIIKTTHTLYMPGLYASISSSILLILILRLRKNPPRQATNTLIKEKSFSPKDKESTIL